MSVAHKSFHGIFNIPGNHVIISTNQIFLILVLPLTRIAYVIVGHISRKNIDLLLLYLSPNMVVCHVTCERTLQHDTSLINNLRKIVFV